MSAPAAAHKNQFEETLSRVKVSSIEPPTVLVTVDAHESFEEAFAKLVKHHLLSAPVWSASENKYVGYLELRDLLSILLATHGDGGEHPASSIDELLRHARQHLKVMDGITITYMARRNPFKAVSADASLLDVINLLVAKSATRVRRVAVLDADHKLVNVISSSRCVAYFAEHAAQFGHKAHATVGELNLGTSPVISVSETASAFDTYTLLEKSRLSGVAIVNAHGALVGNISARDLKNFIKKPDLKKLHLSIKQFLTELRQESIDIHVPTIVVYQHSTLAHVAAKLKATTVHRVFVVDDDAHMRPIAVISVADIVAQMISPLGAEESKE